MATSDVDGSKRSVELEFKVHDTNLFFVRASDRARCRVVLAEMVHRSDGSLLEYFTIDGAPRDRVLAAADDAQSIDGARFIRQDGGQALFEFIVSGPCIGGTLADSGAVVREVVGENGIGRVVADVPPHGDPGTVVDTVRTRHDAELFARRERERSAPDFTAREFRQTLVDRLTDRQLEVIRIAHAGGYFDWPRESTAEECAAALGISQPTFTEHLRAGQAKLLAAVFDDLGDDESDVSNRSLHQFNR